MTDRESPEHPNLTNQLTGTKTFLEELWGLLCMEDHYEQAETCNQIAGVIDNAVAEIERLRLVIAETVANAKESISNTNDDSLEFQHGINAQAHVTLQHLDPPTVFDI